MFARQLVSCFAFEWGREAVVRLLEVLLGPIYYPLSCNREDLGGSGRQATTEQIRDLLPSLLWPLASSWGWREAGFGEQPMVPFPVLCSFSTDPSIAKKEPEPGSSSFSATEKEESVLFLPEREETS